MMNFVSLSSEQAAHSNADQMIAFIQQNYHHDVSLTQLAEHMGLSPSYISYLFKKYTNHNFKDYLNLYRVSKAKELMAASPDLKVIEIAMKVGCNHTGTFIRMFKKYEGISPGQFALEQQRNFRHEEGITIIYDP